MLACSRAAPLLCRQVRTNITVSWPIRRGWDPFVWNKINGAELLKFRKLILAHEESTPYRQNYNAKVALSRRNLALLMGVDPEKFTDAEAQLALTYLLPCDVTEKQYQPTLPPFQHVVTDEDRIMEISSDRVGGIEYGLADKHADKRVQQLVELVAEAEQWIEEERDLESGKENSARSDEMEVPAKEGDAKEGDASEINFPFKPQCDPDNPKSLTDMWEVAQIQKLNMLLSGRPALIKEMQGRITRHTGLEESNDQVHTSPGLEESSEQVASDGEVEADPPKKGRPKKKPSNPLIAKVTVHEVYQCNSVETTMQPGTGQITVNGQSYLDYFPSIVGRKILIAPFRLSRTFGCFDISITVDQPDELVDGRVDSLAHCAAMSIASCLTTYDPSLRQAFTPVYKATFAPEYKKSGKKNARSRYPWRKR